MQVELILQEESEGFQTERIIYDCQDGRVHKLTVINVLYRLIQLRAWTPTVCVVHGERDK